MKVTFQQEFLKYKYIFFWGGGAEQERAGEKNKIIKCRKLSTRSEMQRSHDTLKF